MTGDTDHPKPPDAQEGASAETRSTHPGSPTPGHPESIGPYRILEPLGEGGMGEVYLAEQTAPVRRRVALKVIKLGMDSRQVLARFEAERQALALMDHPCVAKVLDGGVTEEGRPYFAMELVQGVPITEHCQSQRLSLEERLELFIGVCNAVQHAHSKGVIHRDLKPSNILVKYEDGQSTPKVIDFGVAKAINQRLTEATIFTQQGVLIGTPEYMSPEQAEMSAQDIDTRSDVYSLGVILYELLTGLRPFEAETLRQAGLAEIQRIIREVAPERPSTRLSSFAHSAPDPSTATRFATSMGVELRTLTGALRRDLDWVVMKCLEKNRERRYETADALGKEIRRFLNGEPVQAGPPTVGYRARKFIKRRRGAVIAGSAIAGILVIATIVSTAMMIEAKSQRAAAERQRVLAESRFDQVRSLANTMLTDFSGSIMRLKGATEARELLARTGLEYLTNLAEQAQGNDELLIEVAHGYDLMGGVQGGIRGANLGEAAPALESFRKGLALRQQLAARDPSDLELQRDIATSNIHVADALSSLGRLEEAEQHYRDARAVLERLDQLAPDDPLTLHHLASAVTEIAQLSKRSGDTEQALRLSRESLKIRERIAQGEPGAMRDLAKGRYSLGTYLRELGMWDESLREYKESLRIRQGLAEISPHNATAQRDLAIGYYGVGLAQIGSGDQLAALQSYTAQQEILRELVRSDPEDARLRRDFALALAQIAGVRIDRHEYDHAISSLRSAVEEIASQREVSPGDTLLQRMEAGMRSLLGDALLGADIPDEAHQEYIEAHNLNLNMMDEHPDDVDYQRNVISSSKKLCAWRLEHGSPAEALGVIQPAVEIAARLAMSDRGNARILASYADTLASYASVLFSLGSDAELERSDRIERLAKARDACVEAIAIYTDAVSNSGKGDVYEDEQARLRRLQDDCEAAIASLNR